MNTKFIAGLGLFFCLGCGNSNNVATVGDDSNPTGKENAQVIYGADNRMDLYEVSDPALLALADSTVALVEAGSLSQGSDGNIVLSGNVFGPSNDLCTTEPFYNQEVGAFCSGFLVASDTMITAGHCIKNADDCANTKFVFGFSITNPNATYNEFPQPDVVGCRSVVHAQSVDGGADFAVIKLDRIISNHLPLKLRESGTIAASDPVFVIGHPSGLPTKIAGGANVRDNTPDGYFVANLDTYGGNSGSAVFNANTLEVEGVLVRGENDFVSSGNCMISNKCPDGTCRGEDVTKISEVLSYLSSEASEPSPGPTPSPPRRHRRHRHQTVNQ